MKNIYSIRKTTLGVGSVLIGSLLFMGQEAMAQEVSVLPESEVFETDVLLDDELEENAVFEDEEVVTNVANEVLPPVEVDADSNSPFTFVKGEARITEHHDELGSNAQTSRYDIVKLDITFKVSDDMNYRNEYGFGLTMPVEKDGNVNERNSVMTADALSKRKVDLKIGDVVVGKLENNTLSFNERLEGFKNREITLSTEMSIAPIYVTDGRYDGKVNLPLDVYLNRHLIHRFNIERDPIFEDKEKRDPNLYMLTNLEGGGRDNAPGQDPLRLDVGHNFGPDDLKKEGRITYTLPEGLAFESDDGGLNLTPVAKSLLPTEIVHGFSNYKLLGERKDAIEYVIESITPQSVTVKYKELIPGAFERMSLSGLDIRITDYSKVKFTKEGNRPIALTDEPVRMTLHDQTGLRDRLEDPDKHLSTNKFYLPLTTDISGTGTYVITRDIKEKESVEFKVIYEDNPNLPPSVTNVIQEGVKGELEHTIRVTYEDGVEIKRDKIKTETIVEKKDRIIERGTKVTPEQEIKEEEIPFETEYRDNPDLPVGEEKVTQEGKPGKKKVTYEDGKPVNEEVIEEPTKRIIERGTGVEKSSKEIDIPYETEYRDNPHLPKGSEKVVQAGKNGKHITYFENGEKVGEETIPTVKEIIERGTGDITNEEIEEIPFEKEYRDNPDLPVGEEKVIQKGQPGKKIKRYENGKLISEETVEPVPEIIERGTKLEKTTEEEEIPFEKQYRDNPDLPVGEEKVVQKGQPGKKIKHYENGKLVREEVIEAVPEIIERGTKLEKTTEEEEIPFEKQYKDNPDLPVGEEKVIQKGQPGKKIKHYENGKLVKEEVIDPVPEIIERGTKPVEEKPEVPEEIKETPIVKAAPQVALPNTGEVAGNVTLGLATGLIGLGLAGMYVNRSKQRKTEE